MAKIAILGLGVVGSGVAEVLEKHAASMEKKAGEAISVKYILGRHDYPQSPYRELVVQDFSVIENDPEISVVAECIGGVDAALDYTRRALRAGKSVVTSNKELVAEYGQALISAAKERGCTYLFEASVGGGIPIIRPLTSCLAANDLTEICGILNGTTNYILTKMIKEGLSFDTALKQAQEKGYAESDPTADVEGQDSCRKICILADIAFGRQVYPRQVPTVGITGIAAADVAFAEAAGCRIKLLGRALRGPEGKVIAYVSPHLVGNDQQLSGVEDVFNGIVVRGDAIGDVMFYGRGAGKLPTASAVAADIIDTVRHQTSQKFVSWGPGGDDVVGDFEALPLTWYVRGAAGTTPPVGRALPPVDAAPGEQAFLTPPLSKAQLEKALGAFSVHGIMPVME